MLRYVAAAAVALHLMVPALANACAVCYGAADGPIVRATNAAILFLVAMVAVVFAGVGGFLWAAYRRSTRRAADSGGDGGSRAAGAATAPVAHNGRGRALEVSR